MFYRGEQGRFFLLFDIKATHKASTLTHKLFWHTTTVTYAWLQDDVGLNTVPRSIRNANVAQDSKPWADGHRRKGEPPGSSSRTQRHKLPKGVGPLEVEISLAGLTEILTKTSFRLIEGNALRQRCLRNDQSVPGSIKKPAGLFTGVLPACLHVRSSSTLALCKAWDKLCSPL